MSTTKKVVITLGTIALIAGAGYIAYTYCPAVKDFVDRNAIPYVQYYGRVAKDFAVNEAGIVKKAFGNAAGFISEKGAVAKHALKNAANSTKIFISEKALSAKNGLGNAAGFIAEKALSAKNGLQNAAYSAKTFIAEKAGDVRHFVFEKVRDSAVDKVIDFVVGKAKNFAGNISSMFSAAKGWFSRNFQTIS